MAADRNASRPVHTIAPSDLTFLLTECPRCFYNKVALGQRRPSGPMPGVFSQMDRDQKNFFHGQGTSLIDPSLPPGVIDCEDAGIRSVALPVPHRQGMVQFRGAIDNALRFEDGTYGVGDFKTTRPSDSHIELYWLQLQCYALALENPSPGFRQLSPITTMGLVCLTPDGIHDRDGRLAHHLRRTWIPMRRDDDMFMALMNLVVGILDDPVPPEPGDRCQWCRWCPSPPKEW